MGHLSSQRVVVPYADFIHGDRIVFIDDGYHAEPDERTQGVACIEKPAPIREVVMSEQDLRHLDVEPLKRFFVCPHEPALADRRCRLLHGKALGVCLQA